MSTVICVLLAFAYAYGLTRTCMPARGLFRIIAQIPILAPSLLPAISLVYLFGNQGLAKGMLFGASIYGPIGIVIGEVFWTFPHALIIITTALAISDARLYEAAEALRASPSRTFWTVTIPGRPLRPDQRGLRRLHARDHRLRRAQGDRRPVQRARDRHLQAGGRPAELPDGGRGRPDPASARRDRVPGRPDHAATAVGAPVVAGGALRAEARPVRRPSDAGNMRGDRAGDRHHARRRVLRLDRHLLALQPDPELQELRFRPDGWRRLGQLLQLARDGGR